MDEKTQYEGVLLVMDGTVLSRVIPLDRAPEQESRDEDWEQYTPDLRWHRLPHDRGEIIEIGVDENGGQDCGIVAEISTAEVSSVREVTPLILADHGGLCCTVDPDGGQREWYLHWWWQR